MYDDYSDELLVLISQGLKLYKNFQYSNRQIQYLKNRDYFLRKQLKTAKLSEIRRLIAEFNLINLEKKNALWRQKNYLMIAKKKFISECIQRVTIEDMPLIENLLNRYQYSARYVLYDSEILIELAKNILPGLEELVNLALRFTVKFPQKHQYLSNLIRQIAMEKIVLAETMLLRLEVSFSSTQLFKGDVLFYTYSQLIKEQCIESSQCITAPQGQLTLEMTATFYDYIQKNGSEVQKNRLYLMSDLSNANSIKWTKIYREKRLYWAPQALKNAIPSTTPWFGYGRKFRFYFFEKYTSVAILFKQAESLSMIQGDFKKLSSLNTFHCLLVQHEREIQSYLLSWKGISSIFLDKTKKFTLNWLVILQNNKYQYLNESFQLLKKSITRIVCSMDLNPNYHEKNQLFLYEKYFEILLAHLEGEKFFLQQNLNEINKVKTMLANHHLKLEKTKDTLQNQSIISKNILKRGIFSQKTIQNSPENSQSLSEKTESQRRYMTKLYSHSPSRTKGQGN